MGRILRLLRVLPDALVRARAMRTARGAPPGPETWGLQMEANGHLHIGGRDCADLAEEYSTPLHVADADLIRAACARFTQAIGTCGVPFEVFYSYKTNPVPAILDVLHAAGMGAEVVSPFELWLALARGVSPDCILYNGPGKEAASLRTAVEAGIRRIHLNSLQELERVEDITRDSGRTVRVGLRICQGGDWAGPFGFRPASAEFRSALERLARSQHVELDALHMHSGSIISKAAPYQRAVRDLVYLLFRARDEFGLGIKTLNLGGGFGVPTVRVRDKTDRVLQRMLRAQATPAIAGGSDSIDDIAAGVAQALRASCRKYGVDVPALEFEPGRVLTSAAQVLLTRVREIKSQGSKPAVAVLDAGMGIASVATWELHAYLPATRLDEARDTPYRLVGPGCTPADTLTACALLPRLEPGDLIAIMDAGAYFTTFESNFGHPRPPVVLIDGREDRLARSRERFEDIVSRDQASAP